MRVRELVVVVNEITRTSIPCLIASWLEKDSEINVTFLELGRGKSLSQKVLSLKAVSNSDIIHTNQNYSAVFVTMFRLLNFWKPQKNLVLHTLHTDFRAFSFFQKLLFVILIAPFRQALIVNSKTTFNSLPMRSMQFKSTVIPHGVMFNMKNTPLHPSFEQISLIVVGRLVPVKNQQLVIKSLRILLDLGFNAKLTVCGKGPSYLKLKELSAKLNLTSNVTFTGELERSEVQELVSKSQFFIMASFFEGFGVATIESIANGTLPICSDINIHREIIGFDRLLFDHYSPRDLAETIIFFVKNPTKYRDIQKALLTRSKRFSKRVCEQSYLELYHSLTG